MLLDVELAVREVFSPVACTPSSEEMRCKMGADLEADNPQALILLPCGRFPGNPFPVARDGAVKPVGIDTTQEQLKTSTGEATPLFIPPTRK